MGSVEVAITRKDTGADPSRQSDAEAGNGAKAAVCCFTMTSERMILAVVIVIALAGPVLAGSQLRLDEERMSLEATDGRLQDILREFVHAGVAVKAESGLDAVVNGNLDDIPIQEGLDRLLGKFSYVLYWDVLEGPVGPLTRLSGIHVFRPGRREAVVPFLPDGESLVVVRIPGVPAHVKDEVLLGVKPGTTPVQFKELVASMRGTVVDSLPALGVYQIRLPRDSNVSAVVAGLVHHPSVAAVEPNYVMDVPPPTRFEGASEDSAVRPPPVPGEGDPALAVFDSGMLDLEALRESVVGTYDAVSPSRPIDDPVGHGTQMALIATGTVVPDGAPAVGPDQGVPVLAIRSFDEDGQASNFTLLRGIDYAVEQGSRVISMSWGTEVDSEFLAHAVGYAQDQGLVVVASAGNEPSNREVYPAAYQGVVAVAALEANGSVWESSNYGDWITVAAPGTGAFPVGYEGPPGTYVGTSIASPYVARALTLYLADHPDASADEAVRALTDAVTDTGAEGRDPYYGYGALDADAMDRLLGGNAASEGSP